MDRDGRMVKQGNGGRENTITEGRPRIEMGDVKDMENTQGIYKTGRHIVKKMRNGGLRKYVKPENRPGID
jgi:hypothetical protein